MHQAKSKRGHTLLSPPQSAGRAEPTAGWALAAGGCVASARSSDRQEDAPEPALSGSVATDADPNPRPLVSEGSVTQAPGKARRGFEMESLRRATLEGVKAEQFPACCSAPRQVVAAGDLSRGCGGDKPGAASAGRISWERSSRTPRVPTAVSGGL